MGSGHKVLTVQTGGPKFGPQQPHEGLGAGARLYCQHWGDGN